MDSNFKQALEWICPECGEEMEERHRDGDMLAPEADWFVCSKCGYDSEPQ